MAFQLTGSWLSVQIGVPYYDFQHMLTAMIDIHGVSTPQNTIFWNATAPLQRINHAPRFGHGGHVQRFRGLKPGVDYPHIDSLRPVPHPPSSVHCTRSVP